MNGEGVLETPDQWVQRIWAMLGASPAEIAAELRSEADSEDKYKRRPVPPVRSTP